MKSGPSEKIQAMNNLETKLRKYAVHCQRLETEKTAIIDALKSCSFESEVDPESDVAGTVVSLCERLQSAEEESNALANSEEKAVSYMMELDRLRNDNNNLQNNLITLEEKFAALRDSEAGLTSKLRKTEKQLKALDKQRDDLQKMVKNAKGNAADLQAEKGRQVRYLEQENLQLMQELKLAKRDVQKVKSELDALKNDGTFDTMVDFNRSIPKFRPPQPPSGKENQPHQTYIEKPSRPEKDYLKESPLVNLKKDQESPLRSVQKTYSKESPFASLKKSISKKSRLSMTPKINDVSLGVDNMVNEDETVGECKQS